MLLMMVVVVVIMMMLGCLYSGAESDRIGNAWWGDPVMVQLAILL